MASTMNTIIRYEIREFGVKGSVYSRTVFRRIVDRSRALKIVKRLKRSGRDVTASPIKITKGGA